MSGVEALPIIAGFLAVWLTAILNRPDYSPALRRTVAAIVSALLGIVALIVSGQIAEVPAGVVEWIGRIVGYIGMAIISAQGFYKVFQPAAENVEQATTKE